MLVSHRTLANFPSAFSQLSASALTIRYVPRCSFVRFAETRRKTSAADCSRRGSPKADHKRLAQERVERAAESRRRAPLCVDADAAKQNQERGERAA